MKGVRFVTSGLTSIRDSRLLATTDGSLIQQTFLRMSPNVNVTAVSDDNGDFQTRNGSVPPRAAGWEYIVAIRLDENVPPMGRRSRREAGGRRRVEPGVWDLVLHPSHLWLTIHESIGHPTELDRAMGFEANYAGTSFSVAAREDAQQVPVRAGVHERAGQSHGAGRLRDVRLGR